MENRETNAIDHCSNNILMTATTLEEEFVQQNKLEAALKQETMELHEYCEKRVAEIAHLRRTKWELEEKLQMLNVQSDVMNLELENENKAFEIEMLEATKVEQAIQQEKAKQIKNVEEYEEQMNQLFQQLNDLPLLYNTEKMSSDIQKLQEMKALYTQKLTALTKETQLYNDKYEFLATGEANMINTLNTISTELEENTNVIKLENEQGEKTLQSLRNEAIQLKQDILELQKFSS